VFFGANPEGAWITSGLPVDEFSRQEDVKKLILKRGAISAWKKIAPGCVISDR
jgi:hypothetical protein